jgi:hypothetical protein
VTILSLYALPENNVDFVKKALLSKKQENWTQKKYFTDKIPYLFKWIFCVIKESN